MIEGISLSANPYSPSAPGLIAAPRWTAPANAEIQPDGMLMTVHTDRTKRDIHEFYSGPRGKTWMNPFKGPMYEQMRINKNPSQESTTRFERYWQNLRAQGKI